jgi:FKBP-type peptidyl-prolyl cis-trans isomerase SlpA
MQLSFIKARPSWDNLAMTKVQVHEGAYLTLHYALRGPEGEDIVNTFNDKPATLTLGAGQLAQPIEARLIGLEQGAHTTIALAEGEAFGPRNPELVQRVSKKLLAKEGDPMERYSFGDIVQFTSPQGAPYAGVVKEVHDDYVLMDFNHPLAGQAMSFEVKLIGVL